MTHTQRQQQANGDRLYEGEAAILNTARGQFKSFVDELQVLANKGTDALVEMDARLEEFDADSRRVEPTEAEKERRR